jgi:Bacteriocin-protection, YdeI or OmpD-Associated
VAASARFTATIEDAGRGRALIRLPFDPDATWGSKRQHHVRGAVSGNKVRGPLRRGSDGWALVLGAAWLRDNPIPVGGKVEVVIEAEGPQNADLAPDVAAALQSSPEAAAFFAALATFYRKAYLRWIDGASRRPEIRAQRVRELVVYLEEGRKQRPR